MTLQERYNKLCNTPSSVNELLQVLRRYAEQCESVAEFGVDIGQSTTAFLMAQPQQLISIDLVRRPELDELFDLGTDQLNLGSSIGCKIGTTRWVLSIDDSRTCKLSKVDLLFIDSSHHYAQMQAELERHHVQVRKFILCHDVVAYGEQGEAGLVGILPAIREFLVEHPEWREKEHLTYNNGLLVMERIDD